MGSMVRESDAYMLRLSICHGHPEPAIALESVHCHPCAPLFRVGGVLVLVLAAQLCTVENISFYAI